MEESLFYGDPVGYNSDQMRQLAQVVVGGRKVDVTFIVDLPPIGVGDYDQRVTAMFRALQLRLPSLVSGRVSVKYGSRTGGLNARVGFIIAVQ